MSSHEESNEGIHLSDSDLLDEGTINQSDHEEEVGDDDDIDVELDWSNVNSIRGLSRASYMQINSVDDSESTIVSVISNGSGANNRSGEEAAVAVAASAAAAEHQQQQIPLGEQMIPQYNNSINYRQPRQRHDMDLVHSMYHAYINLQSTSSILPLSRQATSILSSSPAAIQGVSRAEQLESSFPPPRPGASIVDLPSSSYIFGVESLAVASENAELVKCAICMHIYQSPVACGNCLNHFCSVCIRDWLQCKPGSCPLCKNYREMRCVPMLRNMLDRLFFVCSNKLQGCEQTIPYEQVLRHEDSCDFRLISCPTLGCGKQMIKKLIDQHVLVDCEYTLSPCRWCQSKIKRKLIDLHEESCDQKLVSCETCESTFTQCLIKSHLEICPDRILSCKWCTKPKKAKEIIDHEDCCCDRVVRCSGCSYECLLNEYFTHTKTCLEISMLCHRCKEEMKRKDFNDHTIEDCIQNIQKSSSIKLFQLENETKELKEKILSFSLETDLMRRKAQATAPLHWFSLDYKDQDIFVSSRAANVALVRESKKKRRDRFVICESPGRLLNENSKVIFKVVSRRSEWFAVGICDESNVYATRKYQDTGHLSYLISANGTLYSSHSRVENWQNRPFNIEQYNVISVEFIRTSAERGENDNRDGRQISEQLNQDVLASERPSSEQQHQGSREESNRLEQERDGVQVETMKLKFVNHTKGQEVTVELDPILIKQRKFHYCACLRSPGDCIEIVESLHHAISDSVREVAQEALAFRQRQLEVEQIPVDLNISQFERRPAISQLNQLSHENVMAILNRMRGIDRQNEPSSRRLQNDVQSMRLAMADRQVVPSLPQPPIVEDPLVQQEQPQPNSE